MPGIDEALDHLVYATPHLQETVEQFHRLTGVRPAEGGRHEGLGTRNHLLGLGGRRYLEIIGPDEERPAPGAARPFGVDALTTPALVTWAIRADDIEERVAAARLRGHDPGDVQDMSRRTPGGDLLTWRLAYAETGLVPFLIDWGTTPHPAERGLPSVPLVSFSGTDPDPAGVRTRLDAVGAHLDVMSADATTLTAILDCPAGQVILT
ncbi:VOC family protein [Actinomadura roseirufa]|uniref:VOC family protein n=1 Tax=Actinomadura roseirufa TaxID=2094049 RepID=UPI00104133AB|nr:VOC family protein [Actinomadura roseirufa]